jgi:chaperone required for assembly of F1-ATPase
VGVRSNLLGRRLAASAIARAGQHNEAMGREILGYLKADPLIGSGDECDGLALHGNLHC